MYVHTLLRDAKMFKTRKKAVFLAMFIIFFKKKKDGGHLRASMQKVKQGSIFMAGKYMFRVCFENPFTRMISNLKYKWPPPGYVAFQRI